MLRQSIMCRNYSRGSFQIVCQKNNEEALVLDGKKRSEINDKAFKRVRKIDNLDLIYEFNLNIIKSWLMKLLESVRF